MCYKLTNCIIQGNYRYKLKSIISGISVKNDIVVIQCNPSTADGNKSDPTVGKVSIWAKNNGFSSVTFLNLFSYITENPDELFGKDYDDIVGKDNDKYIKDEILNSSIIILAWGEIVSPINLHYKKRLIEIKGLLAGRDIYTVGNLSYKYFPRHGLAWNKSNTNLNRISWVQLEY